MEGTLCVSQFAMNTLLATLGDAFGFPLTARVTRARAAFLSLLSPALKVLSRRYLHRFAQIGDLKSRGVMMKGGSMRTTASSS